MPLAIVVRRAGAGTERILLSRPLVAGGSRADGLLLPACPPAALRLVPRPAGVVLEAAAPGLRVRGRPVPPGTRRLLLPGDRVEIAGVTIEVEPGPREGETRAAAAAVLLDAASGTGPGPHLLVLTGPSAGDRHPISDGQTVGRGRSAGIRIQDPRASRLHARIRLRGGIVTVEDLRSKNGVRLNGVRVERRPCALRPGDELLVGETLVALEAEAGPAAPAGGRSVPAARTRRRPPGPWAAALLLALSAAALALAGS